MVPRCIRLVSPLFLPIDAALSRTYVDVYFKEDCNRTAYDFWQKKVSQRIKDPKKRAILAPEKPPHTFGTVRPSLETNYYNVLDQDNVDVVHVKENPIERFTEKGIKLKNGEEKEFDFIVLVGASTSESLLSLTVCRPPLSPSPAYRPLALTRTLVDSSRSTLRERMASL